ncbi:MAG: glycosyltransferase family 4 protein [Acidobacteria bacterium]|nr:glycosyltransferase family 4 protein [Acidobacteriota bacterium]
MKILILIEISSLGGHVLSALTTGKELSRRGHSIQFAGGDGPMVDEIRKYFPFTLLTYHYNHGSRQTYFTWGSLKTYSQLSHMIDGSRIDHIHAFDARSYIISSILGVLKGIPVTGTLCGGITPYYVIPKSKKLIVFSPEQKRKLNIVYKWNLANVEVLPSRLDMEQFVSNPEETACLCGHHGIDASHKNIVMITNFLGPKVAAVRQVLEGIQPVVRKFPDVSMVFVGARGEFYETARSMGEAINKSIGRQALRFTGPIIQAHRILPAAFAVIGTGRGAFEGMAYRKPTLIVGERGYAGTVGEDNIEDISYFNFSGRNNSAPASPSLITDEISRLLTDPEYYKRTQTFGRHFLEQKIDIRAGIGRIESVYEENSTFARSASKLYRVWDLTKTLSVIMADNYYNQFKLLFSRHS